jgi:hypothetical protein
LLNFPDTTHRDHLRVLNLGASLKAAVYAGATVNKYMTLAALLLGYPWNST